MEIFEIFNYELRNDDINIHPLHACDPCRRKLEHYKKVTKKTLAIDITAFGSHSEQWFYSTPQGLIEIQVFNKLI